LDKSVVKSVFPDGTGLPDGRLHEAATSAHGVVDRMATGAHQAALSVDPAIDRAAQVGHHTIDSVADVAGSSAEWLRRQGGAIKSSQANASAGVQRYVAIHPWQSIAIAIGAGFLLGRWKRREIK
jgi:ElaB/YqjD/DUF883 family membrane-anchored ribosome-binding protein